MLLRLFISFSAPELSTVVSIIIFPSAKLFTYFLYKIKKAGIGSLLYGVALSSVFWIF
nr:MAG TPA: hypothetical protein [Caudoviricetes sp.]